MFLMLFGLPQHTEVDLEKHMKFWGDICFDYYSHIMATQSWGSL